jgi:hypothetical protein
VTAIAAFSVSAGGVGLAGAQAADTTLCGVAQETCEPVNRKASGTTLEMSTTQVTFLNTVSTVTCTSSSFKAVTEAVTGEPLPAKISTANAPVYGGCKTAGGTECKVTSVNTPYNVQIKWTSANNGTFKLTNSGVGVPGVDVKCGLLIDCRFTAEVQYTLEGGKPAKVKVVGAPFNVVGMTCPAKAELAVLYTVNTPSPLYVAHI